MKNTGSSIMSSWDIWQARDMFHEGPCCALEFFDLGTDPSPLAQDDKGVRGSRMITWLTVSE